jgi:hypothetical protein
MPAANRLVLGAPGLYHKPEEPIFALTGARMDVCAFVGVAPRGPARPPQFRAPWAQVPCGPGRPFPRSVAVPVESFDAYRRLYGGFEGPGLLPYAVASFFEQGGRRAYIVRIVHHYTKPSGSGVEPDPVANEGRVASGTLGSTPLLARNGEAVVLRARDEGAWGNRLTARLSFRTRPLEFEFENGTTLRVARREALPNGALLRFHYPGDAVLRYVAFQRTDWDPALPELRRWITLDSALPSEPAGAEVVEGTLEVDDHDGRKEVHGSLGFSPEHPRFLARVLYEESTLLHPTAGWIESALDLGVELAPLDSGSFGGGADDYESIEPEDFFDEFGWTPGDPCPGAGIHALVGLPDLGSVVVPDLYSPAPLAPVEPIVSESSLAGPEFADCVPVVPAPKEQAPKVPALAGLRLDPTDPADRETITALQLRVVELADTLRDFFVLLDVPPGLNQRQILRWRERFGSPYAAAYFPWLKITRSDDGRDALIRLNPSAVAAGIIAQREVSLGVPHGPANVIARGVVDVESQVGPTRHAELHRAGINVYLRERDGVRLSAARTLSREPQYRQLSVARLMTLLRRTLEIEMQWAVFEPNDASLRLEIQRSISAYLRRLYRANAFVGATENEAFFVRCDDELNPPSLSDQGRLLVHVGVAPAEPLEFLVLRVARGADGTLTVEG